MIVSSKNSSGKGYGFDKKAYRKEVSRLASLANKRLKRLEESNLTDSPAYQKWVEGGKVKFSVKGKDFNQLQAEMSKLNSFVNSKTSTIRGLNGVLKDMAANTGIRYKNMTELRSKAGKFFELSSKVEQYLRTVEDLGSAIGYHEIWDVINEYTDEYKVDLEDSETNIDDLVKMVSDLITKQPKKETHDFGGDWVFLQ